MSSKKSYNFSFSPSQNAFLLNSIKDTYAEWPDDATGVTDEVFEVFSGLPPEGKCRAPDDKGMPEWVDLPEPSIEALTEVAQYKKRELRALADSIIAPLQDAVDLDEATEAEVSALTAWKKYRVLLSRLDVSSGSSFTWPDAPEA